MSTFLHQESLSLATLMFPRLIYLLINLCTYSRCMNCFLHCGGGIVCQLVFVSSSRLSFRYISASTTIRIRSQTPPHTILLAWTTKKIKKAYTYYVSTILYSHKISKMRDATGRSIQFCPHSIARTDYVMLELRSAHGSPHKQTCRSQQFGGLKQIFSLACLLDFKLFRLQLTSDCFSVDFRWCYPYPQLPSDCFYHPRAAAAEERKTCFGGPFFPRTK